MGDTWPIGYCDTMRDGTIIEVAEELIEGSCKGCFFDNNPADCKAPIYLCECMSAFRDDHIGVIFKKVDTQNNNT